MYVSTKPAGAPESQSVTAWLYCALKLQAATPSRATLRGFSHLSFPRHSDDRPSGLLVHRTPRCALLPTADVLKMGGIALPELPGKPRVPGVCDPHVDDVRSLASGALQSFRFRRLPRGVTTGGHPSMELRLVQSINLTGIAPLWVGRAHFVVKPFLSTLWTYCR
jgi:hypothetical protein